MINSLSVRRSRMLRSHKTLAEISRGTGIPTSTLSYVSRGRRDLPIKYEKTLRNYYQRTSYQLMRSSGISTSQAHRFSWYRPERIQTILVEFELKVKVLTEGLLGTWEKTRGEEYDDKDRLAHFKEAEEKIRKGIEKSLKVYEEWIDYGSKYLKNN